MKTKILISIFFALQILNPVYSQNSEIKSPCDCLEIVIKNHELIKKGISEYDANKILENQNIKCVELKNNLGSNFEREILLCENFTTFSKIINEESIDISTNSEICNCVNSSIKILAKIKKTGNEIKSIEKYKDEAEGCELLRQNYSDEEYAKLMMNCPNYTKLMTLIIELRK
ncbi:MAG: hypothetical protein CMD08_03130 [Flavobacteriales bacterium]|nr:hypothetical protein [Flavobacteriales bacterium]|tara:strand:- start:1630 stop:2148 length:519 start_codon:yes stop_codon:yes gene_type:complete